MLTLNALLVLCAILVRMANRDHIADPIAALAWLSLGVFQPEALSYGSALVALLAGLGWAGWQAHRPPPMAT